MTRTNRLEFQISDWNQYHEIDELDEEVYNVQIFGRTADDKSVCLKVKDFCPFFYLKVPNNWSKYDVSNFITELSKKITGRLRWKRDNTSCMVYQMTNSVISYDIVKGKELSNFSDDDDDDEKFVKIRFKSHSAMKEYSNILKKPITLEKVADLNIIDTKFKLYECNMDPYIKLIHIKNLSSSGWIAIDINKAKQNKKYSVCDHSYEISYHNLESLDREDCAKYKLVGYDIECTSSTGNFPQAKIPGDKIIQIGLTQYRFGSTDVEYQCILVLKKCYKIKNADVLYYRSEKNMIRGWAKKVRELCPDVLVGFNNFGFDDLYIYNRIKLFDRRRAKKLGLSLEQLGTNSFEYEIMSILGKVNNAYVIDKERVSKSLTQFESRELSSSAMGQNNLFFFKIPGIVSIDMMKVIQREHTLPSYTLDNVISHFIKEKIVNITYLNDDEENDSHKNNPTGIVYAKIKTNNVKGLENRSHIQLTLVDGYSTSPIGKTKYKVLDIQTDLDGKPYILIKIEKNVIKKIRKNLLIKTRSVNWSFAKDDITHHDIFNNFKSGCPKLIRTIAKYCLKDCRLNNLLLAKLDTIINNIGMAKVCDVPLSFMFFRGQGIKLFSLVSKKCRERGYFIPLLDKEDFDNDDGYEGAIVINPEIDAHLDDPTNVLDFNSLYPNSMIMGNLSHETYVDKNSRNFNKLINKKGYIYHEIMVRDRQDKKPIKNIDGTYSETKHIFAQKIATKQDIKKELANIFATIKKKYNKLYKLIKSKKHYTSDDVTIIKAVSKVDTIDRTIIKPDYTAILIDHQKKNKKMEKEKQINNHYNIVQGKRARYGIIPEILVQLLNKRKETNARLESITDSDLKSNLNGLQLAYKVVANSLYGQTGAVTSPIYKKVIAECTTALGRKMLYLAKSIVETNFKGSRIIYGDTDSIFISFNIRKQYGLTDDKLILIKSIELALQAADLINDNIAKPQRIVYEKTFFPFVIVARKKYVGLMYTTVDKINNPSVKSMGIVLKRRDNAPIVKIITGGIIDNILFNKDVDGALAYTNEVLEKIVDGKYDMSKFIMSKRLRGGYAKPESIAHKVLADRIASRDPGNKPQIGDRIQFVYRIPSFNPSKNKKVLQGSLVETPKFIIDNNLKVDYLHYLNKQITKPVSQILNLLLPHQYVTAIFKKFTQKEINNRLNIKNINNWIKVKSMDEIKSSEIIKSMYHSNTISVNVIRNEKTKKIESENIKKWIKLKNN
jgi:DNA polymerase elongation subunit (family B)